MPKCVICENVQAKLNKGDLCKDCFNEKDNRSVICEYTNDNSSNDVTIIDDRTIMDIIKENMTQERRWNEEMTIVLKDQIEYLKDEIIHKNTLIESLIVELHNSRNTSLNKTTTPSLYHNDDDSKNSNNSTTVNSTPLSNTSEDSDKHTRTLAHSHTITNSNSVANEQTNTLLNDFTSPNIYRALIIDEEENFDRVYENNGTIKINREQSEALYTSPLGRPNVVVNQHPHNDNFIYQNPMHVPGNSSYAKMTNDGKKILILSDSICSRIQMKEFNTFVNNGYAYRKSFPGATPKELAHYCIPTLLEDKPDTCIINVGTNSLRRDKPLDISNEILNIVGICHNYGVNNVYVSSITYRPQFQKSVSELNKLLLDHHLQNDFKMIVNDNITGEHIWKDKIHLNHKGTIILANNFIKCINNNLAG